MTDEQHNETPAAEAAAEAPAAEPVAEAAAEAAAQPAAEPAADGAAEAAAGEPKAAEKPAETAEEKPAAAASTEAAADQKEVKRDRSRERSRSRSRDRRERDRDFKARSRSRSRDRRRSRSRSRDRRRRSRSRTRSRSRDDDKRRSRRSRFEEETDAEREERRKKAAAAAAAASTLPGGLGAGLGGLDPTTAALLQRQQILMQQQLLQQQAALQAQAVMQKAVKTNAAGVGTQAQRLAEKQAKAQRELFVGNLAPGAVNEASLYQVFHSALIAAFPQAAQPGQEPVLKVTLTGRFAFVEFRMPEYATAALQLNGQIALMGNTLKIARPSSYVEPSQMAGGMMGGMGMPGAMPNMGMPAPAAAPPMMPQGFPGMPGVQLPGPPSVGSMGGGVDPMATPIPTPFLGVNGMITADVLTSDEEYKEVLADLAQECSKYGMVLGLKVPRPPPGTAAGLIGTGNFGKAFVQFADVASAQRAKDAISGRMFAGNIVQAYHVPVHVFQSVPESH